MFSRPMMRLASSVTRPSVFAGRSAVASMPAALFHSSSLFAAAAKADKPGPARAKSAYQLFIKEKYQAKRIRMGQAPTTQVMIQLAGDWKKLSDEEKQQFEDRAAPDKARYEREMAAYKASLPKRKLSGYNEFTKKAFAIAKEQGSKTSMKETALQWSQLSDSQKQDWNDFAARQQ